MPLENSLKVQRVKMGINQAELGNLVGVSRQTISLIERGDYNPSITLVLKLSKVFDVAVEEIFSYQEDKEDE
ncbi:MAG: XRE family transcriptional regulator [Gracilibacter sp. BRH_c7a]|nr:MAG: XRE family transcriptional regulator [Gracilibacter sp. BRH_c7a]